MKPRYAILILPLPVLLLALYASFVPGCAKLNPFTEPPDHPVIDSIAPAKGGVGTQLRLYGSGFSTNAGGDSVTINGVRLRVDSPSTSTVLLVTITDSTGTGHVHIKVKSREADGPIFTFGQSSGSGGGRKPVITKADHQSEAPLNHASYEIDVDSLPALNNAVQLFVNGVSINIDRIVRPGDGWYDPSKGDQLLINKDSTVNNKVPADSNYARFVVDINGVASDPYRLQVLPAVTDMLSGSGDFQFAAGDTLTITGNFFGNLADPSSLDMPYNGVQVTQPHVLSWKNQVIRVIMPTYPQIPVGGSIGIAVKVGSLETLPYYCKYLGGQSVAHVLVSTVAGNGTQGYLDGPALSAEFQLAWNPAVDASGNIYVSDHYDDRVRKITPAGMVSTLAGTGVPGFKDGPGDSAQFSNLAGITTDAQGNVYVADFSNSRIRKITPAGVVSTFAGGAFGYLDGPAVSAKFLEPWGVTADGQGNFFVADTYNNRIRKISAAGTVSTVAGNGTAGLTDGPAATAQFNYPYGVALDAQGNIYVADTYNNVVRKITSAGVVSTLAGTGVAGFNDGPGATAQFNSVTGITIDNKGNLYVVDNANNRIRMITPAGVVSTIAGNGTGGRVDGPGPTAQFGNPYGICIDTQGNLYVGQNTYIRKITFQ